MIERNIGDGSRTLATAIQRSGYKTIPTARLEPESNSKAQCLSVLPIETTQRSCRNPNSSTFLLTYNTYL